MNALRTLDPLNRSCKKRELDNADNVLTVSDASICIESGFGLSIGSDEDLEPTIGVDYDLGGLNLYAGYDADDQGGSIGATLSF